MSHSHVIGDAILKHDTCDCMLGGCEKCTCEDCGCYLTKWDDSKCQDCIDAEENDPNGES